MPVKSGDADPVLRMLRMRAIAYDDEEALALAHAIPADAKICITPTGYQRSE